jgi:type II secretory pathway pseudopilin PulG
MRRRCGWVFIDVLMGIILVSIIAVMLGLAAGWHQRALKHLADSRSATRLAESALLSMETGQITGDAGLTIHRLSTPPQVPGKAWVEVDATVGNCRASLIGLVPQKTLPGGGS